jgi:transposase
MTDHTPISPVSRLEVISTGARRRWTLAEKQRIVAESYSGPVSATARRNCLSASQLFTWRRLAREGRLGEPSETMRFAAAVVADASSLGGSVSLPEQPRAPATAAPAVSATAVTCRIEIVLRCGHRVVVDNEIDATALAARFGGPGALMIPIASGVRVWLATGHTDMRKGFATLAGTILRALSTTGVSA